MINSKLLAPNHLQIKFERLNFASRVGDARGDFTGIRFSKLNPRVRCNPERAAKQPPGARRLVI